MPIVNTGLSLPGAKSEFFQAFDKAPTHFGDLTTRIPSKTDIERYRWLGSLPPMREWGTGRKAKSLFNESYDIENLKYEITLEVDRDEISDDQTGQIMTRVHQLAERAAQHKDRLIADLLANGATSGFNSYDGVSFFNDAHESGDSGSQSNVLTPSATDADAPTAAEFRTALSAAITQLLGLKDDQGEPMSISGTGLVAVVPAPMYMAALEAINATVGGGSTNTLAGAASILAFPRLTDASKWFLLKTDVAVRALIFQDRESVEFSSRERDSETGFIREVFLYGVRARYRVTYGYWQYAIQSDFTAS